jgi:magnesium-transporting ATPase (P-type)
VDRQFDLITLNIFGTNYTFQILHTLEFTSSRKRMSVIVKLVPPHSSTSPSSPSHSSFIKSTHSIKRRTNKQSQKTKEQQQQQQEEEEERENKEKDRMKEDPLKNDYERIFLFIKGADNVLLERAHPHQHYIDRSTLIDQTKVIRTFLFHFLIFFQNSYQTFSF